MPLSPSVDLTSLAPPIQRILAAQTPAPLRMMAANGAAPGLRPEQLVIAIALLARGGLAHVEETAQISAEKSLTSLAPQLRRGALASPEIPPGVIDALAAIYIDDLPTIDAVVMHPRVAIETIVHLASAGGESVTELVATNEERLLAFPEIIEKLYLNKQTRMSTADRVLDLAVRNGKELKLPAFREAAEAIVEELISAADAEATPDDLLFREAQADGESATAAVGGDVRGLFKSKGVSEDGEEAADGEEEELVEKALSLDMKLRSMTVSQKIRTAMIGTAAARALLVRDKNKQVAAAVIKSPSIQENEVSTYAASRSVSGEVLRLISANGDFTKSHVVKLNLCANPKTPIAIALRLLQHLRNDELKKLGKSKQVPNMVQKMAKQELGKRKPA